MSTPHKVATCSNCGGTDLTRDASARWSIEAQDWELSSTHDVIWCNDCDEECEVVMSDVPPNELNTSTDGDNSDE